MIMDLRRPSAKSLGTIKRFRDNGKCHNGEKIWTFGTPSLFHTRQLRVWLRDPAAPCARVMCERFTPEGNEGAGKAGCPLHPQPRVRNKTKHTSVVTTVTPEIARHSPRNGFTAYFVLSPARSGLFVTVVCASSRRLDTGIEASEPHDFAVRVSTIRQVRCPRPPHPAPRS